VLVVGTIAAAVALSAALVAGRSLARRLVPSPDPGCGALATIVLALTIVLTAAQLLGAAGQLRPWPVFLGIVVASAVVTGASRGGPWQVAPRATWTPTPWHLAHIAVAVVVVRWLALAGDALASGMKQADTLWYHVPFAARFVQERGFPELRRLGYAAARWFPFDGHLVHALGILAVDSDALSPFVNLGWAALALAAAHTIGRRHGRAELTTTAAAAVLALPILAATQPGQASTDIPVAALCLTAVALLLSTNLTTGTVAIAGCALGLAVSTKTTAAAFGAVMALGVLGILLTRRQRRAALAWTLTIAGTGTFWFVRNWVVSGNPLPWFDLPGFDKQVDQDGPALLRTVFDADAWSSIYLDGMAQGLTNLWPLVIAIVLGAIALLAGRGTAVERAVAVALGAGVILHVLTPLTGGLTFAFNLRYLAPTLLVAAVLLPTVLPRGERWSVTAAAAFVAVIVAGALSDHSEGAPPWTFPVTTWALLALVLVIGAALATRNRAAVGVVAVLSVVIAVPLLEQRYLDGRYVDAGLVGDRVNEHLRDVRDERVGVLGTDETLPMFGLDLSNDVELAADPLEPPRGDACTWWRTRLADRYDLVVLYGESYGFGLYYRPPVELLTSDDAVTVEVRDRDSYVLRIAGDGLDPTSCE
jgi:hypothetical protein